MMLLLRGSDSSATDTSAIITHQRWVRAQSQRTESEDSIEISCLETHLKVEATSHFWYHVYYLEENYNINLNLYELCFMKVFPYPIGWVPQLH